MREDFGPKHEHENCGCSTAPCCFQCPLSVCKFDVPPGKRLWQALEPRNNKVLEMTRQGVGREAIAAEMNLGLRTVDRIRARDKWASWAGADHLSGSPPRAETVSAPALDA